MKVLNENEREAILAALEGTFAAYRLLGKTDREYAELVVGMFTDVVENVAEAVKETM